MSAKIKQKLLETYLETIKANHSKADDNKHTFFGVILSTISPSSDTLERHSTGTNSTRSVKFFGLTRRHSLRKSAVLRTIFFLETQLSQS